MICYGFKCGSGTSSRKIDARLGGYTVGVFVQANHGTRSLLRVAGAPVGQEVPQSPSARNENPASALDAIGEAGSIIIVVATDAPLLPHPQTDRPARDARPRADRQRLEQRIGRHLPRFLDGERWRRGLTRRGPGVDALERADRRRVRGDGAGH